MHVHHNILSITNNQDRKAELASKKAKLEELRKQREQRGTTAPSASVEASTFPSPSHKPMPTSAVPAAIDTENSSVADLVSSLLGGIS